MINPGHQVIDGFKEGNAQAFRWVYMQYHRALYHFTEKLIDDKQEAEDIVAETFVKLWNLKANFETTQNIKAFLYITARNASLNFVRYRKRQTEQQLHILYLHEEETPSEKDIPVTLQLMEQIQHTLDELPYRQKEIMKMILFEGLDDYEVARRLNKNPRTIQNLKSIAVKYLRLQVDNKKLVATTFIVYCLLGN